MAWDGRSPWNAARIGTLAMVVDRVSDAAAAEAPDTVEALAPDGCGISP
jgi:hypothetical protein